MLKRTKSYLLFTLIVLTGFAGSPDSESLSAKERRILVASLRDSRKNLTKTVQGFSEQQLDFRPGKNGRSIRDHLQHQLAVEMSMPGMLQRCLKAKQAVKADFSDAQLVKQSKSRPCNYLERHLHNKHQQAPTPTKEFEKQRSSLLKFVRTTTDDLRHHGLAFGNEYIDAYQLLLMLPVHTSYTVQEIEKIRKHPSFPRD